MPNAGFATLARPNPRTRDDYRKVLERYILPVLSALDIAVLTREYIAVWLRAQEESLAGRPEAGGHKRAVGAQAGEPARRPVDDARGRGAGRPPHRQPGKGLGPAPKSLRREMCFLTHTEWAVLHRCRLRTAGRTCNAQLIDPTFGRDLGTLLVGSGLRWSEATALTVGQCHLLVRVPLIRIDRAWKRQPDGTYRVAEPKSRRSVRSVTVCDHVRDMLIPASWPLADPQSSGQPVQSPFRPGASNQAMRPRS